MACDGTGPGYDNRFLDTAKVLASNLPYLVVPLLLVARMWRPHPFTDATTPSA